MSKCEGENYECADREILDVLSYITREVAEENGLSCDVTSHNATIILF